MKGVTHMKIVLLILEIEESFFLVEENYFSFSFSKLSTVEISK